MGFCRDQSAPPGSDTLACLCPRNAPLRAPPVPATATHSGARGHGPAAVRVQGCRPRKSGWPSQGGEVCATCASCAPGQLWRAACAKVAHPPVHPTCPDPGGTRVGGCGPRAGRKEGCSARAPQTADATPSLVPREAPLAGSQCMRDRAEGMQTAVGVEAECREGGAAPQRRVSTLARPVGGPLPPSVAGAQRRSRRQRGWVCDGGGTRTWREHHADWQPVRRAVRCAMTWNVHAVISPRLPQRPRAAAAIQDSCWTSGSAAPCRSRGAIRLLSMRCALVRASGPPLSPLAHQRLATHASQARWSTSCGGVRNAGRVSQDQRGACDTRLRLTSAAALLSTVLAHSKL